MKKEYYVPIVLIGILVILFLQPEAGFLGAVEVGEVFECPEGFSENTSFKPCDRAVFTGVPKCTWDLSACDNYCESDSDCNIRVPAANDCSLFFEEHEVSQIGFCKNSFCVWQQVPADERDCTAFELFSQKYKYVIAIIIVLLIAYFVFEIDFGKHQRGLF